MPLGQLSSCKGLKDGMGLLVGSKAFMALDRHARRLSCAAPLFLDWGGHLGPHPMYRVPANSLGRSVNFFEGILTEQGSS